MLLAMVWCAVNRETFNERSNRDIADARLALTQAQSAEEQSAAVERALLQQKQNTIAYLEGNTFAIIAGFGFMGIVLASRKI